MGTLTGSEWEERESRQELLEAIVRGERDIAEGRTVGETEAMARLDAASRK